MKKLSLALLAIAAISFSNLSFAQDYIEEDAEKKYTEKLKACDITYEEELNTLTAASDLQDSSDKVIKCYENIANEIIEKYYVETSAEHKRNLNNYIKSAYNINSSIAEKQDFCLPNCGSLSKTEAKAITADMIKYLTEQYIVALSRI
jgi:hypothetical protein